MVIVHYHYVGYIAYPQLVRSSRNEVLNEIWVCRKAMRGVCSAWLSYLQSHLEAMLMKYTAEAITADWIVACKLMLVHGPKLYPAYAGV